MEISNTNQHRTLTSSVIAKFEDPKFKAEQTISSLGPAKVEPSTIVSISDEGMALQVKAAHDAAPVAHYVEKTDEEYAAMSYEELIDLRNNDGDGYKFSTDSTDASIGNHGKANYFAELKLMDQQVKNNLSAADVKSALVDFKALAKQEYPEVDNIDFDVSFKDGKAVISGDDLSKALTEKLQSLLDDTKNKASSVLQNSIQTYNKEALTTINMQIYEEKGKSAGSESGLAHRNEPLTMGEFTKNISYGAVG